MENKKNKTSIVFWIISSLLVAFAISAWLFWADIEKFILGDVYQPAVPSSIGSVVDQSLKQNVLSELEKFKQYGEWPISAVRQNLDRGNPFESKK